VTTGAPVTQSRAALELYCRHALDTDNLVKAINGGEMGTEAEDERRANLRVFAIEKLLSTDADNLRREGRAVEASKVADHSTALRKWFNAWVGRGPNPGPDILQDYYNASNPARRMCR